MGMPKGFKHSEATKAKMRNSHVGLRHTEATKAKLRKEWKRRSERERDMREEWER